MCTDASKAQKEAGESLASVSIRLRFSIFPRPATALRLPLYKWLWSKHFPCLFWITTDTVDGDYVKIDFIYTHFLNKQMFFTLPVIFHWHTACFQQHTHTTDGEMTQEYRKYEPSSASQQIFCRNWSCTFVPCWGLRNIDSSWQRDKLLHARRKNKTKQRAVLFFSSSISSTKYTILFMKILQIYSNSLHLPHLLYHSSVDLSILISQKVEIHFLQQQPWQ